MKLTQLELETLVLPAMLLHEDPRRIAILGEWYSPEPVICEVVKHRNLRSVVSVSQLNSTPLEEIRQSPKGWLTDVQENGDYTYEEYFEVVVVDSVDLLDDDVPVEALYEILEPQGVFVVATGSIPGLVAEVDDKRKLLVDRLEDAGFDAALDFGDEQGAVS